MRIKDCPEKRLGRNGSRDAIDWIDAVQQLEGSICPHRFEHLQLFALILTDRPALGIYGGAWHLKETKACPPTVYYSPVRLDPGDTLKPGYSGAWVT